MPNELSLNAARKLSQEITVAFTQVDTAIWDLRAKVHQFDSEQGWAKLGYPNFESWAAKVLPWSRTRCLQIRKEALTQKLLAQEASKPIPGSHLKILEGVPEAARQQVYKDACAAAEQDPDGEPVVTDKLLRAAVRAHKESHAPAPDEEADIIDGEGLPVEKPQLRKAFSSLDDFEVCADLLTKLKRAIVELASQPGGAIVATNLATIQSHHAYIANLLDFARPHTECPWCHAADPKCKPCRGRGFVNKATIEKTAATVS